MKLFHRGYFAEQLRQLRVPGIISACILVASNVSTFFSKIAIDSISIPDGVSLAWPLLIYVYIAGLVMTLLAYGWMNHRRTCDFYHALPIHRTAIYGATTLAILFWLFVGLSAYTLVHAALNLVFGMPFNYLLFFCVWITMLICALQMVGATSLACALSGTRFVNLFATAFILFIPRLLCAALSGFMSIDAPHTIDVSESFFLLNPSYNILGTPYMLFLSLFGSDPVSFSSIPAMVYSLFHASLLVVAGGLVFRNRGSELAGTPTRSRIFQGAIRTAFGLPLLLLAAYLMRISTTESTVYVVYAVLIVFAFIFYCLYELISTKRIKKMLLAMPLFSICIGIAALYLFVPQWLVKGTVSSELTPDTISGYRVVYSSNTLSIYSSLYSTGKSYIDIRGEEITFTDPDGIRLLAAANMRSEDSYGAYSATVTFLKKNGGTAVRHIYLTEAESRRLDKISMNNDAYTAIAMQLPAGRLYFSADGLTQKEAEELGKIFLEEIGSLSLEQRNQINYASRSFERSDIGNRTNLSLSFTGCVGTENYAERYAVAEYTPRTAARYMELLNEKNGEKVQEVIRHIMGRLEKGTDDLYFSIRVGSALVDEDAFCLTAKRGSIWYSKDNNPDAYEVLRILADAEPTDEIRHGVWVRIYSYDAFNEMQDLFAEFTSVGYTECFVSLTDAEYRFILQIEDAPYLEGEKV